MKTYCLSIHMGDAGEDGRDAHEETMKNIRRAYDEHTASIRREYEHHLQKAHARYEGLYRNLQARNLEPMHKAW